MKEFSEVILLLSAKKAATLIRDIKIRRKQIREPVHMYGVVCNIHIACINCKVSIIPAGKERIEGKTAEISKISAV